MRLAASTLLATKVNLKCQRNERYGVTATFPRAECRASSIPYILALLHRANTRATCSYVMTLRVAAFSLPPLPPHFIGPSSALCARTQRQLILSLISFPARMRTCNYLDTLSPCRNYVIPGNRERRSESQLVYLSARREHGNCSLAITICSQMIGADIVLQNYRHFFHSYV